jgi:hypothetical protein
MATFGDAIKAALQDLGVVDAASAPSAEDSELARLRANDWLDSLQHDHLAIPYIARTTWTLTTASSYTIGAAGTIVVARPASRNAITAIGYIDTAQDPDAEYLVENFTDEAFAEIAMKAQTNSVPYGFYYRPTSPTGTIIPWPIPDGTSTLTGVIYTLAQLTQISALTDTFTPATGYARFFRTNLAVELAPAFEREPSPSLLRAAMDSKAQVLSDNYRPLILKGDPALSTSSGGRWDINTDQWRR